MKILAIEKEILNFEAQQKLVVTGNSKDQVTLFL